MFRSNDDPLTGILLCDLQRTQCGNGVSVRHQETVVHVIDLMLLIRKHRVDIALFLVPERIQFPGLGFQQIALSIIRIADQLCLDVFPGIIFYTETVVVVGGIC